MGRARLGGWLAALGRRGVWRGLFRWAWPGGLASWRALEPLEPRLLLTNTPPQIDPIPDAAVAVEQLLAVNATFTDPDPDSFEATINWGDGSGDEPAEVVTEPALAVRGWHTYDEEAAYTVTVRVSDGSAWDAQSFETTVLMVSITGATELDEGSQYDLTLHTDPEGQNPDFQWRIDWGDGTGPETKLRSDPQASHTYQDDKGGPFAVSATAECDDGIVGPVEVTTVDGLVGPGAEEVAAVLVQADGRILVLRADQTSNYRLCRYLPDGQPDLSFGYGGSAETGYAGYQQASLLELGGGILLGYTADGDFRLERYDQAGHLDRSFGDSGSLGVDFGGFDVLKDLTAWSAEVFLAVGNSQLQTNQFYPVMARFDLTGQPDQDFNADGDSDGKIACEYWSEGSAEQVAVQSWEGPTGSEQRIVLLGLAGKVYRAMPDGAADTGFGTAGCLDAVIVGGAEGLAIQRVGDEDRILLAGTEHGGSRKFGLARYTAAGLLDAEFAHWLDSPGVVWLEDGYAEAECVAVRPDGRIVIAGHSNYDFGGPYLTYARFARLNQDGSRDVAFGSSGIIVAKGPAYPSIGGAVEHLVMDAAGHVVASSAATFPAPEYRVDRLLPFVTVHNVPPTLTVSEVPEQVSAGVQIDIRLQAQDPGSADAITWNVNWGDGSSTDGLEGRDLHAAHTYAWPGELDWAGANYTICAWASDGTDLAYALPRELTVSSGQQPRPTDLTALPQEEGSILLSWNAPPGSTPDSYRVYRFTDEPSENDYVVVPGSELTYLDETGLVAGQAYHYLLTAVAGQSVSEYSNEAVAEAPYVAPPAPAVPQATGGDRQVAVEWSPVEGTGITYNLYRATSADWTSYGPCAMGLVGTSYVDSGLDHGTTYYYRVSAVRGDREGPMSESVSAATFDAPTTVFSPPHELKAEPVMDGGQPGIRLSWTTSFEPDAYAIYRSTTAGELGTEVTSNGVLGDHEWTDHAFAPGTTYYYTVIATSYQAGDLPSRQHVGRFPDPVLPAVENAAFYVNNDKLCWTRVPGADEYYIERSTDGGYTWVPEAGPLPASTNQHDVTLCVPYRITARGELGDSDPRQFDQLSCDWKDIWENGVVWPGDPDDESDDLRVDLDIDSDNDRQLTQTQWLDADRVGEEGYTELNLPGLFIVLNNDDDDGDFIPDFADGFGLESGSPESGDNYDEDDFVPFTVEMSRWVDGARFMFQYDVSPPWECSYSPGMIARGNLRIWRDVQWRNPAEEYFVDSGVALDASLLGLGPDNLVAELYLEAVGLSGGLVVVYFDDGSDNWMECDSVRVTVVGTDVDVDSDNDGVVSTQGFEFGLEDEIEDGTAAVGSMSMSVNSDDDDGDGIVDLADGFGLDSRSVNSYQTPGEDDFAALTLLTRRGGTKWVQLRYELAALGRIPRRWDGADAPEFAPGALRIWALGGDARRCVADLLVPGKPYDLDALKRAGDGSVRLYVEGASAGASRIEVFTQTAEGYWRRSGLVNVTVASVEEPGLATVRPEAQGSPKGETLFLDGAGFENSTITGKFVLANVDDGDADGVLDCYDGFDADGRPSDDDINVTESFVPLVITLADSIDLDVARLRIQYKAADPDWVVRVDDLADGCPEYLPTLPWVNHPRQQYYNRQGEQTAYEYEPGSVRLWTMDGSVARSAESFLVGTELDTKGYYVPPTGSGDYAWYAGDDLLRLGFGPESRSTTLYIEGVRGCSDLYDSTITVEVDPDGEGPADFLAVDTVQLTVMAGDMDIDSDNTSQALPDRDWREERVESLSGAAGKVLVVNDADRDEDGIPDFADFETQGEYFVPVQIEFPSFLDPFNSLLAFEYSGSDPFDVGGGQETGFVPAEGALRLWTVAGGTLDPMDAAFGGHFVVPCDSGYGWYRPGQLGWSGAGPVTLYLEAVRPSERFGDLGLAVYFRPTGYPYDDAEWIHLDSIQVTSVQDRNAPACSGPVCYADGSITLNFTDLTSEALGGPWQHGRTYTTRLGLSLPEHELLGNGWTSDLPYLVQATGTVMVVSGGEALYFDFNGNAENPEYRGRFGVHSSLTWDGSAFVLADPDGGRWQFEGFDPALPAVQRGSFAQYTDPAGNVVAVDARDPAGRITRIKRTGADAQKTVTEVFDYAYNQGPELLDFWIRWSSSRARRLDGGLSPQLTTSTASAAIPTATLATWRRFVLATGHVALTGRTNVWTCSITGTI